MKVKIKSFNGELPEYLTQGKAYNASQRSEFTFFIEDDEHCVWMCLFDNCPNLNGGSWEIVE